MLLVLRLFGRLEEMAAKPLTPVLDGVFTSVSVKPLDVFHKMSSQIQPC